MATFLLDTSVIVDALNNKRGRVALLVQMLKEGHLLACCPINLTEVYAGMRPKEETTTEAFLASLRFYEINAPAARLAGLLKRDYARKGKTLNLGDVMIAGVAIQHHLTLLTDNLKDFPMEDLSLYPWPKSQTK